MSSKCHHTLLLFVLCHFHHVSDSTFHGQDCLSQYFASRKRHNTSASLILRWWVRWAWTMVVEVCLPRVNRRENAVSRHVRDAIPLSFAHATISEGVYRLQPRPTSTVQSKTHCKLIASLGSVPRWVWELFM